MKLTEDHHQEILKMANKRTLLNEDILNNVYRIKAESRNTKTTESVASLGTGFTVFRDKRIYLVTAAHLFDHIHIDDVQNSISIQHDNDWKKVCLKGHLLGISAFPETDIAVFLVDGESLNRNFAYNRESKTYKYNIKSDIPPVGQQVIFVGYPSLTGEVSYSVGAENSYNGFPKPFLKTGCFSYYIHDPLKLFVDGLANKGFSGGPIMFRDEKNILYYCGIVSRGTNVKEEPGYTMICGGMGTVNEFIDHLEKQLNV